MLLYPLGALATVGVHFAQALPDVAIDRAAGLPTATSRLGQWLTFVVAWLTTLSAPVLAWLAAWWLDVEQPYVAIDFAAALTLLLLAGNVILIAANRRIGIAACFPLVALSTLGVPGVGADDIELRAPFCAIHSRERGTSAAVKSMTIPWSLPGDDARRRGRVLTGRAENRIVQRSTQCERASSVLVRQS